MVRRGRIVVLAAVVIAACGAGSAGGHSDPCHTDHSCPSDDHSYVWQGMSCTSDPAQRLPEDQAPVDEGGVHYYCHTVVDQGMTPPGTTTGTTPAQTTPATPSAGTSGSGSGGAGCGGPRAAVATLSDPGAARVAATATATSIAHLHGVRAPASLGAPRVGAERRRYRVLGRIRSVRLAGGTWTLTVADPRSSATITAAFPPSACLAATPAAVRTEAAAARRGLVRACRLSGRSGTVTRRGIADVTGVGFFRTRTSRLALAPAVAVAGLVCR
ncbi:hypothetical protein NBH00_05460 [Paraconexibacter antarcticus]|uniref:Uncharacterized protein n=1 Tax=Paraconexibacter antarcticus TaxID=2949664 RepID=A0ABY5DXR5_9ACTN|nr:hypothetical protein [Paraconexibacter antarcticus]UTI65657.1 hypothetical protein NBH00_05460 [Paraconexibacter antarcticus]